MRRDLVCLAILLLVALTPALRDLEQAAQPGPAGRIAINREIVNRVALAERTLPLWNPYEFGGRPHLANPETLALYPPHILLRLLPLPLFFALSLALHTWLAGAGTYLAARAIGASRLVSMLAGGAVIGSRLLLSFEARARSLDVYAVAWLPLIAALSLRSAASPGWRPHPGLVVAASLGLLASGLNPAYVLATVAGSYLFSMIWLVRAADRTLVLQPIVLTGLVAGLTAVQIAPTVRLAANSRGLNAVAPDDSSLNPFQTAGAPGAELVAALRSLAGSGRVLSTCTRRIDGTNWVPLGVPDVGGSGGVFPADYGRFSQAVRGATENTRPTFEGIPEASSGPARADLLGLLGVQYLVACDSPNAERWSLIGSHDGVGIYRSVVSGGARVLDVRAATGRTKGNGVSAPA